MSNTPSFDALEHQYSMINRNFNTLFADCETESQRNNLRESIVIARKNFRTARYRIFHENDPIVASITTQLIDINAQIEGMIEDYETVVGVLKTISAGVKLGSSLVVMGSSSSTPSANA